MITRDHITFYSGHDKSVMTVATTCPTPCSHVAVQVRTYRR